MPAFAGMTERVWCSLRGATRFYAIGLLGRQIAVRDLQIVICLEVHPEFRAVPKIQRKPQRRVSGDAAAIVDDLGNAVR